jgi:hypothetical protein
MFLRLQPLLEADGGPQLLDVPGERRAPARDRAVVGREPDADEPRDDEEAFEQSGAFGPVPGELGSPSGGEPAP